MCQFKHLYLNEDEFVICCRQCGSYQVGFAAMIISLSKADFKKLKQVTDKKLEGENFGLDDTSKSMVLPTPYHGISLFLSKNELQKLSRILEHAENEEKAQCLISLFNA